MSSTEKRLLYRWIAWNTLAWSAGIETIAQVQSPWWMWIACGAIVGTAQWLALHRYLQLPPVWIAGTGLAWVAGIWAGYAHSFFIMDPYWVGLIGGSLAGFVQCWVLWRRVAWPALWVPSTIVSSTLGWVAGTYAGLWVFDSRWEFAAYLIGGAVGGAVIGATSAPLLWAIVRHSKPQPQAA
jgi:hypothetical protein